MSFIRKSLLQLIFSGSFMKRWNDKLRPVEFWEVDKQAHKMMIAWILYIQNSAGLSFEEQKDLGREVIEGGIFEYLYRLIITDIKPPIFYQIKSNPLHYRQLTEWVLEQLEPRVQPLGEDFWERLTGYFLDGSEQNLARRILSASHLYASQWEFSLIETINPWDEELEDIRDNFESSLREFGDIRGVPELTADGQNELTRFVRQCGQLRFQKRWSQTPRIPETSVLGHLFIVACYAYFFSLTTGSCAVQSQNNFFAGLFHDLPELLTRDIISPVKRSVQKIGALIKEYEDKELRRRVFQLLEQGGFDAVASRLAYFLGSDVGSEFVGTVRLQGEVKEVSRDLLQDEYNRDQFDPKDGELLKVCDSLAAFIEAYTAMRNGINTDQLQQAVWRIRSDYSQTVLAPNLHVGSLLADFD
ncbi:MAG: HD domain-containing protein [Desulfohalobiaceae bacterium]|nr:HD domain-containing protein [Desulfohalobiaceae bacterium]